MKKKRLGSVRVIGGKWRGTRVPVPDIDGLRPSGDRSRETLFNWLQGQIQGSRCVDLFAGSGVLGIEAASRGAAEVILVEKSRQATREIRETLRRLNAEQVSVIDGDAITWLDQCGPQSIDIVFIDPPFGKGLEVLVLERLATGDGLRNESLVYLETARDAPLLAAESGWEIIKEKLLGDVRMQLLKKNGNSLKENDA